MKSWSSTQFLVSKKQELLEAASALHNDCATVEEMSKHISLGNGIKKCFLEVGILSKGAKIGKSHTLKINLFNCTEENIRRAYSLKESAGNTRIASSKIEKVHRVASKEGLVSSIEVKKAVKKEVFPSIEDCIAFLKHHYGVHHEVILIQEGYKLDSYTVKSVKE